MAVYKLSDDVYCKLNKQNGHLQVIKLTGKDVIFDVNLIAAEIIQMIDGRKTADQILSEAAHHYDKIHGPEIREKGAALFKRLLLEEIIFEL
jgi:hypothetical protein